VESAQTADHVAAGGDEALVRLAGRGDVAAFEALVASRIDRCYRLAWSILEHDADAADATQEAFVAAWRELPRLRDPGAFDAWLNRIVANAARMSRRRRVRLREIQLPAIAPTDAADVPTPRHVDHRSTSVAEVEDVAERDAIDRAFARLRPDERAILVLHHLEARPVVEIARSLGVPVGTAKWRLHAARRALERAMEAEA
jgi:RNA polymerase sigma-70 factor (ECF subfamily)